MAFSEKQKKILAFPNSSYDALICDGSVRSGKTSIMAVAFIMWAMRDFDGCNFAICSKTVQTTIKNVIRPLLAMTYIKNRYHATFRQTSGELVLDNGVHINTFYIYGGKDESSYMLIQGITLAGVLLDEVALMPRSFVEQALARCSVDGSKFWFNCNPAAPLHWFNQEWVLQPEKHNALRLHFTMDDNPSLSTKVRKRYESMYTGVFYDRYIRGLWVSADGIIYDMFSAERHVVSELPETEGEYYVSADYGIQNATTFLLWRRIKGDGSSWILIREYFYSGRDNKRQKTVKELTDGLTDMLDGVNPKYVIVDPSAAALIVELRNQGFKVLKANNDVLDGITDVSSLLQADRILIYKGCKHTLDEIGIYAWDEKAAARGEDKPIKENDHCMDAMRYFVRTLKLARKDIKENKETLYLL